MRPRIKSKITIGHLVGSTNPITYATIRTITVEHHYDSVTYKRIKRVAQANN